MCFFHRLFKRLSKTKENNEVKEIFDTPNIFSKDGTLYVRQIDKLSDEELVEIVGHQIIQRYYDLIILYKLKNKKVSWSYIPFMKFYNEFTVELIKRSSSSIHVDINMLIPYINKLNRPYTLSHVKSTIQVIFIYIPTSEIKSEEYENKYLDTMINMIQSLLTESIIFKGVQDTSKNNTVDNTVINVNTNEICDMLLEAAVRQRKV